MKPKICKCEHEKIFHGGIIDFDKRQNKEGCIIFVGERGDYDGYCKCIKYRPKKEKKK